MHRFDERDASQVRASARARFDFVGDQRRMNVERLGTKRHEYTAQTLRFDHNRHCTSRFIADEIEFLQAREQSPAANFVEFLATQLFDRYAIVPARFTRCDVETIARSVA
jgi:hypothetical protein